MRRRAADHDKVLLPRRGLGTEEEATFLSTQQVDDARHAIETGWRGRALSANLCQMDEATVRAMLEQHFSSGDPYRSHEMYHDDAILEFPQSGERFVGVASFREWRSNYPESTTVEFRQIRGRDDLWVAELSISYDQGPWNFGVSILEFRGDRIARESIYVTESWEAPEWRARWRSAP